MMADGLTKLASAEVMTKLRNCMNGELPPTPGEETAMESTDKCWWALMVLRPAEHHNSSVTPVREQLGFIKAKHTPYRGKCR